ETQAKTIADTHLQTEAVSLLGAKVDKQQGTLSLMVLERGASSRLFSTFKVGDPIAVMGPTGVRTKIPSDQETVMIVGGRMSAAQILEVGSAMRKAGNRVLYVGGFETAQDLYCQDEIEAAADVILWVTQSGAPIAPHRPQDRAVTADFIA